MLYKAFFDRIEKDKAFFNYNGVTAENALILAKTRAKNYLNEAISLLKLKCTLEIDIQLNDDSEEINVELNGVQTSLEGTEIYLIASIMYEIYLSRDISTLKTMINSLTSSDIKMLYAPSNERKTFMDMFTSVQINNLILIDNYNGRNRSSGNRKVIDYSKYAI